MKVDEIALQPHENQREWIVGCGDREFVLIVARGAGYDDRLFAIRRTGNRGHGRWRKLDTFIVDNILPNWTLIS